MNRVAGVAGFKHRKGRDEAKDRQYLHRLETIRRWLNLASLQRANERKIEPVIPSETIEQVAAANDIVEVIGSYFPLKRAGTNFKALCPFHQEKTPSFHVSPQRQTFHCFGCGVGGSAFRFVMEYEHVDFPSAVRKLAARVGIPIVEERASQEEDRQHESRRTLLKLHAEAAELFHENLLKKEFAEPARTYLKNRGIDRQVAKDWQIGFAPDSWDAFLKWALGRGYSRTQLLQSGLIKPRDEERPGGDVYDRFRGRIMFPICNDVGEVIAFSGRLLESDPQAAKYVNSPETPLFQKGRVLFGLHKTKRALIEANCAIVCEGQLDLISLFEAGIKNVVAPQGTAFTDHQARILKRFVEEVVLCFDADQAGQKAAQHSLDSLLQHDLVVRIVDMPAGEDPDSLIRRKGKEEFEKRVTVARDFFDYWIEREVSMVDLSSMGAKMQLARKLAEIAGQVRDPLMRGQVLNKMSARLGVPASEFEKLVPQPRRDRGPDRGGAPLEVRVMPRHDVAMLCLLALRDETARNFLLQQNWRELLQQIAGTELLTKILESDLRPDDAASLNSFMSKLSAEEEGLVSAWLMQKVPANAMEVIEGWWKGLMQGALRRQLEIAETRIRLPQLSTGEVVNLQKEIVDLREQLQQISGLSSVPEVGR
ncbi:MAG TPA: DNA primase [Chthoniobacterales bacterium]|jgi:DNA primase|nr:DNA primase [Chthoniobacterales bacterium]